MNKDNFIRTLATTEGLTIKDATKYVNTVLEHMVTVVGQLKDGESLDLTGYLQFKVNGVEARTRRNPQTGEPVEKEATRKVKAKAMTKIKEAVLR